MSSNRPGFASDNYAGAHPDVMRAVVEANGGHQGSYGADSTTARAHELFRQHFGNDIDVAFTFNGTGSNIVALQSLLRPYENVICAQSAHINVDECGAPERFLGSKLVGVDTPDGKLTPALIQAAAIGTGDQHHVQPKVVSITESTELGTLYTLDEIADICEYAHGRGMYVHLDGARLPNAAAALGCSLGDLGSSLGVDVLSFGATKNGALAAEAVVTFNVSQHDRADGIPFIRKQSAQLASKMRFIAAQFVALLENDLWRTNATQANAMAQRLSAGVRNLSGVEVSYPVQANAVFAILPDEDVTTALQESYPFYVWDESTGQVRWMTSFDTTAEDVDAFVQRLSSLLVSRAA